jgi:hypothetical protein
VGLTLALFLRAGATDHGDGGHLAPMD